LIFE
jgi:hypothetical protein